MERSTKAQNQPNGSAPTFSAPLDSDPTPGDPSYTAPSPDAVGRGVLGHSDTEPLTLFVLSGASLGATAVEGSGEPQWFDLRTVENVDALGAPVDERQRVEMRLEGDRTVVALLPEPFLDKLVERLQELLASGAMTGAPRAEAAPSTLSHHTVENAPMPGDGAVIAPSTGEFGQDQLVMDHVIYHGGFPGEQKRRKGCSLRLDHSGVNVSGANGPNFHLDWEQVASVEVQNPDEAKFRLNIKVKRNSTSFVVSCLDGSSVLLEARDVPTVPMRHAVADLLTPHGVSVA